MLDDRFRFESWWGPFVPLALALLVGFFLAVVDFGLIFALPFQIFIHELGHAIPSWFSGRAALPLPFGVTFRSDEQSKFVMLCMAFLVGLFLYRSIREKAWFSIALGVTMSVLLFCGCVLLQPTNSVEYCVKGGMAGEILIPGAIFVLYHYRLPDKFRWDFWRMLAVFPAALTFFPSLFLWMRARKNDGAVPRGGMLGDGNGDVDRLLDWFGWTLHGIAEFYAHMAIFVGMLVLVHTSVHLLRAYAIRDELERSKPAKRWVDPSKQAAASSPETVNPDSAERTGHMQEEFGALDLELPD